MLWIPSGHFFIALARRDSVTSRFSVLRYESLWCWSPTSFILLMHSKYYITDAPLSSSSSRASNPARRPPRPPLHRRQGPAWCRASTSSTRCTRAACTPATTTPTRATCSRSRRSTSNGEWDSVSRGLEAELFLND